MAILISSQSRYDHFDTAPYLSQHQHLRKRGELMGRTSKNIKLRIPEKPRKIKGFRTGSYRVATTISSRWQGLSSIGFCMHLLASAFGQVLFLYPFGRRNFIVSIQSAPVLRPSSPPRGRCFCRHRHGTSEAAKTTAKPGLQARAKPHTGSRGVPRRTIPCRRQGIVRYTALTTAHENARSAL